MTRNRFEEQAYHQHIYFLRVIERGTFCHSSAQYSNLELWCGKTGDVLVEIKDGVVTGVYQPIDPEKFLQEAK